MSKMIWKKTSDTGSGKAPDVIIGEWLEWPEIESDTEQGITKEEFFKILDKAAQPIKREAESDSKKSET